MRKLALAAALTTIAIHTGSFAADTKPEHETSFNAALTSDYRYRGISQTRLRPALQGGVDYVHNPSGFYAGTWASTIKWTSDAGGDGDIEIDLYAGKRGQLAGEATYDFGVLSYVYPSNSLKHVAGFANADTTELYGQVGFGPAYIKYSHAVTNLFGFVDSKNSGYLDIGANLEAGSGVIVNLHAGRQRVRDTPAASYTDWKVGVSKDLGFATCALAVIGTNAGKVAYASPVSGKFLGRIAVVATLSKTF